MHLCVLKHALNSSVPIKSTNISQLIVSKKRGLRFSRIHNLSLAGFIIKSRNIFHHLCTQVMVVLLLIWNTIMQCLMAQHNHSNLEKGEG